MTLEHGSLEGPENGVYVRGFSTINKIKLPDYWEGLVDESTITVQLTPKGRCQTLYVESISNNVVTVRKSEFGGLSFFYNIYGERKDVDKIVVEK